MTLDECKELAEWFFRQKVTVSGFDYVQLQDGSKITFTPDIDGNLTDALEDKMIEQAGLNCAVVNYSNKDDADNRVRYSYYKFVTNLGTTYAIGGTGTNSRDARIKAILQYIRSDALI